MGEPSPWRLLIVAAVFIVLFGSKKLPDAIRSLGRSLRSFKAETQALRDDPTSQPPPYKPSSHSANPDSAIHRHGSQRP